MALAAASVQRVILCVDMDYFFAQCEERRRPELQNHPVVVCVYSGRTATSGVVSAANYVARNLGVRSGLPIVRAQKLLQHRADAVFLPVDHDNYEVTSARVMELLRAHADRFESASIDEAFLDVSTRSGGNIHAAVEHARELKRQLRTQERLSCSVGVGPNKLLAKMAADFQKPDGLTIVRPDEAASFFAPLPVERLYGVGPKSAGRLHELGIRTIGDLASMDPALLLKTFGRQLGRYLHRAAQGTDDEPVAGREGREQISRIATLKEDTRDVDLIYPVLEQLAQDIRQQANAERLGFRSVAILVFMEDLSVRTRTATLERLTTDATIMLRTARELLLTLLEEIDGLKLRRIGLRIAELGVAVRERTLTEFLEPSS